MSAAVESRLNGHGPRENGTAHVLNGKAAATNGTPVVDAGDVPWEEQFLPQSLRLDDKVYAQKVAARLSGLVLCGDTLRRVEQVYADELESGLQEKPSSLQMANTYVPELPNGTEEGLFLALDLGGTNFRVLLLELRGGQLVREDVKQYHISDELRMGPGTDLFDYLADCVLDFVKSEGMEKEELSLGFTFSFPMKQHSILSGELVTWTKSFKCGGMEGVDVSALLQSRLNARGLRVTVQVLLNDTTGTLVAGAHIDPDCGIGVIMGTGSNGCYMERASRVRHWEVSHERVRDVCIDIEWGAFGDNGCLDFIRTEFDDEVDANSLLATSFTFEKYIGGKYLGCALRAALAALARDGLFFAEPPLRSLLTADLSAFEEEAVLARWEDTAARLSVACGKQASRRDALVAQHVAHLISNRAAQLVSVCIATILRRMDRAHVAVAVDGSVFKRHPRIRHLMDRYIALLAPDHHFRLFGADDGSGKGSALTAAIAARLKEQGSSVSQP